ncbi:MAG: Arc family DNA-binding protein [Bacteroidota bacterium]
MPSLTLKGIPEDVLDKLRRRAEEERRSLNQQAIRILEEAVVESRPSFVDLHRAFVEKYGPPPFGDDFLDGVRSQEPGRPSPFEDEEDRGAS